MRKEEKLLSAFGEIDEKYIKEAESKMSTTKIVKLAVIFAAVIALSLYLFIPFAPVKSDLKAYEGSDYFPLIEEIDEYRLQFMQPKYKNNFQAMISAVDGLFGAKAEDGAHMDMATGNTPNGAGELIGNGSYVEVTDNQVDGVVESDLFKMTDKYIFRLGYRIVGEGSGKNYETLLRVYTIDKENSGVAAEFVIPYFADELYNGFDFQMLEMYLSEDCNTVTLVKRFYNSGKDDNVGIISIDVSDINNIREKGRISVEGALNTSRMVDGRLLLITEFSFNRIQVNYSDPTTFVPTIDSGNGIEPIKFENIIYPEKITGTGYSVVALIDAENLGLLGANALLNFTSDVYVSKNNLYISREYTTETEAQNGKVNTSRVSDIAVINYSGDGLIEKGIITVRGWMEDQYSFDELDGYLRVVTSARDTVQSTKGNNVSQTTLSQNVSLYIFNLADNSLAYKVEDFAIEGEEATAVRFDGDKLYVCTAVMVDFTDPVYFIDLSDYENISSVDTGVIEGYSDHLINYGEGLLVGIGREDWSMSKVEVYAEQGNNVVSIHEYKFNGEYSLYYKAYLVNREENLFGFGIDCLYEYDQQTGKGRSYQRYVLIKFNAENMTVYTFDIESMGSNTVRAVYIEGYLYITTPTELVVEQLN